MRELDRTIASISPTRLEGLGPTRRRRLESCLRRYLRLACANGWAAGVFDSGQDLVAFDASGSGIDDRAALALLSMVPFPVSPGPVALNVSPQRPENLPALGIAVRVGEIHSLALIFTLQRHSEQIWPQAADAIASAAAEIAEEFAEVDFHSNGRTTPAISNGPDAFFLLNGNYEVELQWHRNGYASAEFAELVRVEAKRLPLFFEAAVRRLTSSWNLSRVGTCVGRTSHPLPGLALRVVPMSGTDVYVGVFVDRCDDEHEAYGAAVGFRISSREREVLHELLDGRSISEIAADLNLAESTVNDHVARMIAKTNARNRVQMAATLLGWSAIRGQHNGNGASRRASEPISQDEEGAEPPRARCSWRYHIGSNAQRRKAGF
jgi:DNA-binding CsgD family transcriptional regulator